MHLQYENIGQKNLGQMLDDPQENAGVVLPYGTYEVDFSIYRQGRECKRLSMADRGFEKPAKLYVCQKSHVSNFVSGGYCIFGQQSSDAAARPFADNQM